jgi:hypothetical protein
MSKVVFGQSPFPPPSETHPSSPPPPSVGNVPYNMGEARFIINQNPQIALPAHRGHIGSTHRCFQISRSGSWLSVRVRSLYGLFVNPSPHPTSLVFDRETGKPKGYGFCEFAGTSHVSLSSRQSIRSLSDSSLPD